MSKPDGSLSHQRQTPIVNCEGSQACILVFGRAMRSLIGTHAVAVALLVLFSNVSGDEAAARDLTQRGKEAQEAGHGVRAAEFFRQAVVAHTAHAPAYDCAAALAYADGAYATAELYDRPLLSLWADSARVVMRFGLTLSQLNRQEDAFFISNAPPGSIRHRRWPGTTLAWSIESCDDTRRLLTYNDVRPLLILATWTHGTTSAPD